MRRSKKFIILALVAAVVLIVSVAGLAFAQTGSDSSGKTLLGRVATILGIDQQKVEDAFAQAQQEMRDEALDSYLKNLISEGKITQEQADQYKTWLKAKPDLAPFRQQLKEWQQTQPGIPPDLKQWQENRPDIPLPGGNFGGFGGRGGFGGGMMRMHR